ncbi:MAG: DAK2 domain-containing protein [Bifidobacteriaceae bacterium]|jgi:dihydroxyacetone kinase-like protein|nr:DAK2 domain-containing protein [Bifidobacteriaceae bacterium]
MSAADQRPARADTIDAARVAAWLRRFAHLVEREEPLLTALDRAIGDGDHGKNLNRGMQAVVAALRDIAPPADMAPDGVSVGPAKPAARASSPGAGGKAPKVADGGGPGSGETSDAVPAAEKSASASEKIPAAAMPAAKKAHGETGTAPAAVSLADVLRRAAMALIGAAGGSCGPLYGAFFLRLAQACGEAAALTPDQLVDALHAGLVTLLGSGKAGIGDKTMVDAIAPAVSALRDGLASGKPLGEALGAAATAAREGCEATISMKANSGLAALLGDKSIGHADPGAASMALLFAAADGTLAA